MRESRSKLKNFKTLGLVLLAVVVVGAIAGGSWFAITRLRQATTYIKRIPELGIQMTVPDSIKDLTYTITSGTLPNGQQATFAGFSVERLTALDVDCSPDDAPLGTFEKALGQYPNDDPNAEFDYGPLLKQFPNFYISTGFPQGACSAIPKAQSLTSDARAAFNAARASIQLLN